MRNTEMTSKLRSMVQDTVSDIIHDYLPEALEADTVCFSELESDTDDGAVFGTYEVVVNHDYVLTVNASALFEGESDRFDYSRDTHYTERRELDELAEYVYEVVDIKRLESRLDALVDQDVDYTHENN